MTPADECSDIHEIRAEIDRIDRAIVTALAERLTYVHAAAAFKCSNETVRALDRVRSMLEDRERWAGELGLDPLVIRRLYEQIVEHFTGLEFAVWKQAPGTGPGLPPNRRIERAHDLLRTSHLTVTEACIWRAECDRNP